VNRTSEENERMDDRRAQQNAPSFRVWLCGTFRVERRVGTGYESVRTSEWGGSSYPRLLLKALLCCSGRQARREALLEMLWPDTDPEQAAHYLNTATTKLRKALEPIKGQASLLVTEDDYKHYMLEGQHLLWVDVDEALTLLKEAERMGRVSQEALSLLEEATRYFNQGMFLDGEEGLWASGKRATIERARYRCRLWLAEAYEQQKMPGQAEMVISLLLEEDPIDEDALCRLMELLHRQGMTQKALRLYEHTCGLLAREGLEPAEATRTLVQRLQEDCQRAWQAADTSFLLTPRVILSGEGTSELENKESGTSLSLQHIALDWDETHASEWFSGKTKRLISRVSDSQTPFPQIWHVPYLRNPFFTGREELLTHLRDVLHAEKNIVAVTQHALCGLGGIGKTQVALEYAYRYRQEYRAIFWVKADTRENLLADFLAIASLLQLPEQSAEDRTVTAAAVKHWFQSHERWLLILDNADDLMLVREFLPPGYQGHVLLTTRTQVLGGLAYGVQVEEMNQDIGTLFLLRRAGLLPPGASIFDKTTADALLAQTFVQEVGGLPLALDQAAAYIEETASSLQEYLDLYHSSRLALLQRRGGLTTDHPESVATTWALAFTRIESSDPVAVDLLRLCAFLNPDAIPEELLFAGLQQLAGPMSEIHQLRFNEAIGSLLRFSLVRRNGGTHTVTVHRLIQSVVRDNLLPEQQLEWIHRVVDLLSVAFPSAVEVTSWPRCEKLLPHALLCAHWIEIAHITSTKAASLLNTIGYYLNMRAQYEIAMPLFQRALGIREQALGELHPDTAQTLSNLAYLYHHQDQFEKAMHFLQRSLFIRQQVLGMEHADTATSLNALALLYRDQGRYEEAEPFFQQALAIRKQIFGTEHPQTAHSLSNLAWLYRNLRKYQEAELLYEQSLAIRRRILGVDHPDTATSLNGLALLYAARKNYAKAEALFQQAVTIRQRVLGTKHLHTTQSMNALALLYRDQGEYEKAERLFLEVLAIREQILGNNHPRTTTSLHNLALLYYNQGKFEQAEPLFLRAMTLREHIFGREHPRTLAVLNNLVLCQKNKKK
jgi:tetratricopeptide (TPR) repeat protein